MFGQRLRLARKKAGLSMQSLAGRVEPKVSAQAISKYESGKMMPSSAVLVGLGQALGVSLDFLMGGQVEALQGVAFRKHSNTSAKDLARAEAIVIEKLEDYLAIEEILGLSQEEDHFSALRCDSIENFEEIEKKAKQVRKKWNLGFDPVPSMTALLEGHGVKVIEGDLPERYDGLACEVVRSQGRPSIDVVVVSRRTNIERKRFNLAHELAHRIIKSSSNPEIKLEKAMNRFAGAFLVPDEHLKAEVGEGRKRFTYHEIVRLKHMYGVSAAALLYRLGDVGIVPRSSVENAFRTFARSWRHKEPDPIRDDEGLGAFEKPQRFEKLVWRALGEELISPVRGAQLLKCSLQAVDREIKGPQEQ